MYHAAARNLTISPRTGPIAGGTLIRITGSDFSNDIETAKCSFGEEVVNAVYATQFEIRCHTPPVVLPKSVAVEIAVNGKDFTSETVQFHYEAHRHIAEIHPNSGPATGQTIISVIGGPFKNYTEGLRCRFADQIVSAVYISEKVVECVSPRLRPRREVQRIASNASDACISTENCTFSLKLWNYCRPINGYQGFDLDGSSLPHPTLCEPRISAPIPYNASRQLLKSILEELPGIGTIRVTQFPKW